MKLLVLFIGLLLLARGLQPLVGMRAVELVVII